MWLEQNADLVTMTTPLLWCIKCVYVFCVKGFRFDSHLGSFHFGSSLMVALVKDHFFTFFKCFQTFCSDLQFRFNTFIPNLVHFTTHSSCVTVTVQVTDE